MAIKTFYLLNTTATAPLWGGSLQDGGSAPAGALSTFGGTAGKVSPASTPYTRIRPGSTAIATGNQGISWIDGTSGPLAGTGSGVLAGDSFGTSSTYTGTFAAGNWTFSFGMRTGAATHSGRWRCQVWASVNQNGSSARKLTSATLLGSIVTMNATGTTFVSSVTWAAPAITLTNEYLFFQLEWLITTAGTSNSCTAQFYQSAGSIVTTDLSTGPTNYTDTITSSALPIDGSTITALHSIKYADTITSGELPISGSTVAPFQSANYADTLTASAVPIGGQTVTPVYTANYVDTLIAGTLPITGLDVVPVYSAGGIDYSDTITPSALPVSGSTITPVYTVNYADTIVAGSLPIDGQAVTPTYTARYTDALVAGALPVGGATLVDVLARGDTLASSSVPVGGATVADIYRRTDTLTAGVLPIAGATVTPIYTARYADTLTASVLAISGQAITPLFSAGGINYSDVIAASSLPVGGQTITAVYSAKYSDTVAAAAVPITGLTLADVLARGDILVPGGIPIGGQTITPVFSAGAPTGKTWVKVGGVWEETTTYVKAGGVWVHPIASFVKDEGAWKAIQ